MKRIYYNFADSGEQVGYLNGEIRRVLLRGGPYDTGVATFKLILSPDESDTGDGKVIYTISDTGLVGDGLYFSLEDTGGDWFVGAGDKLTANVTSKGATGQPTLEVWVYFSENE